MRDVFRHEGPARSDRLNHILAGYLAFVAGYVNSTGFALVGVFTSHVTGNVGRLAADWAAQRWQPGVMALVMIASFFAGAVVASLFVESNVFKQTAHAYGAALFAQAALLALFAAVAPNAHAGLSVLGDRDAAILCAAMGMQNSLVTRLSGAVVRTTHLTGVVTDLGIESARWLRWWLSPVGARTPARNPAARPAPRTVILLGIIISAFAVGAFSGASVTARWPSHAIGPSVALVALAALYAFFTASP